ncbi:MAG: DUF1592 domain-containing protein [Phycisphaerales bacterium]|nr:DUF1592 domain-containing protein [Phycisphaerales bacterium]
MPMVSANPGLWRALAAVSVVAASGVWAVQPPTDSTGSASAQPPLPGVRPTSSEPPYELAIEIDRRLNADVRPLLASYCLACHSGDDAESDVRLDELTDVRGTLTGDLDLRVLRDMVTSGDMPPKEEKQPSEHERLIVSQWIDAALAYVPTDAPIDPGWFTIHRLNRSEYRNTLRDLLGIDPATIDLAARLPVDDMGYGFDNIADVLSTSPVAVEQYLAAAEQAIEVSLGPVIEIGDKPRVLRPLEGSNGQPLPRGGFFLYSNGPAGSRFDADATGDYIVRVKAWETPGGQDRSHMSVRLDGKPVGEFDVGATRDSPQEFRIRTRLSRGTHKIAAHFTNDFYEKDKADRNLGVESISLAGPTDEATTERSAAWSRVFAPMHGDGTDAEKARRVLSEFAGRAYRRPASETHVDALVRLYAAESDAGRSFEESVRTALSAVLVSPNFLFRSVAHPDAGNPEARYSLDGYELASRLSYFLWSSAPDDVLLTKAADGSLTTDAVLAAQTARMLKDAKAVAFVENFCGQWLQLRALEKHDVDAGKFPECDERLRADMLREARLFFADVIASERSVLDLVDSRDTFLNASLASHYGVPGVTGDELRRVSLPPDSPRGGVLTMGAVLTLTSYPTRTSPVKRGLFVLDQILGVPPPPPPADVPPLEQAANVSPDATTREKLAAHLTVASCAACHNRLDPLGLSFEHFDAVGKWRDSEQGHPIDASGSLPGGVALNGSGDVKKIILARSDQFVEALAGKVLTYAIGRGMEPFDRPAVRSIARRTRAGGDRLTTLIESVVLSETFRTCRGRNHEYEE